MKIVLMVMLLVPQLALAKVYMCTDPHTGKSTFTDKGCETLTATEEVKVTTTNVTSGRNTAAKVSDKSWNSDRDARKSGREYNDQRRSVYEGSATAAVTPAVVD
tara:strand:- start:294992 stop:295303 length:312 start_codon:yes stop_codon:yes gene_type:complete